MENYRAKLLEMGTASTAQFNDSILNSSHPSLGIKLPQLRALGKRIAKEEGIEAINDIGDYYYEEVLLKGFVIAYSKLPLSDKKPYIDAYLAQASDWGSIDCFVTSFKLKEKDKELMWQWCREYSTSSQPFVIRFALVEMISDFLDDEHIDEVLSITVNLGNEHYYVRMAQAWLLATAYINYEDKVYEILKENKLDVFTHNKTIQKIRESYRISDEAKGKAIALRR